MVVLAVGSVRYSRLSIIIHTVNNWHNHQINILFQYIVTGMLRFMSLHHFETVLLFIE